MNWTLDLMETNSLLFWYFQKFLSLIRFANDLYTLYNCLNAASRLARFRKKKIKRGESIKRNAELFFVISKATITKTAIKPNSSIDFL